jgi:hypothetical protein
MKAFERIFLYSVLAILVFYVFLVDDNVESKVAIQEEIRARRISIVNDEGREGVRLMAYEGGGGIMVYNRDGTLVALIGNNIAYGGVISIYNNDGTTDANMISTFYGGLMSIFNIYGNRVATMGDSIYGGRIAITNKDGTPIAGMVANENNNGEIRVFNKSGKETGSLP